MICLVSAGPRCDIIITYMKANAVGKNYSEVELAYSAGFLDADGAIMACIEKHSEKKFGFRVRVFVKVSQKNRDVLDWFLETFGRGFIRKNRTTFDWEIKDQKDARGFLIEVAPYLKGKRKQADYAITIINTQVESKEDLIRIANLADALSRLNVRSLNRRKNFVSMIKE